jgi:hypothetical protein
MASSTTYVPLSSDPDIGRISSPVASQGSPDEQSTTLEEASSKPIVAFKAVLALLVSLVCFAVAVLVIVPSFGFSWHLGFQFQLVVIGALIGVQNLCLQTVLPNSLVLLEARLGKSAIQNYDAILRNQVLGSHTDWAWRAGLFAFSILPIAMGIAYKQFLGGTSSAAISNNAFPDALYGLAYPDLGQYASLSNSIFLSMNANSAFLNASRYDQEYPGDMEFPWVYGYNTLVLGQDSAALLDLPEAAYIGEIQGKLTKNETWQVSASVDAIVAIRNESIASLRHDTDFLNQTLHKAYNNFASQYLFQPNLDLGLGWMSVGRPDVGDTYCLMGDVSKFSAPSLYPISFVDSTSDEGFLSFMESAQMFSIRRQACQAKWAITQSEVKLLEGQCFNESSASQTPNSRLLHDGQTSPYALDVLPVLVNTLGPYSTTRPNSNWKQISYVVAAVNAWWARSAFLNFGTPDRDSIVMKYPETLYHPRNQTIMSTRSTLRAVWGLYVVVGALPLVTMLTFLPLLLFYSLPIGRGFGLVSILAGIDRDSLDLVKGAGLSGELERQIRLDISSERVANNKPEAKAEDNYRIRYVLSRELRRGTEGRIERGRTYE